MLKVTVSRLADRPSGKAKEQDRLYSMDGSRDKCRLVWSRYFANPGIVGRLKKRYTRLVRPEADHGGDTMHRESARPVYITRHLSQLFMPTELDSFLKLSRCLL